MTGVEQWSCTTAQGPIFLAVQRHFCALSEFCLFYEGFYEQSSKCILPQSEALNEGKYT